MQARFKIKTANFRAALREYSEVSKRDITTIINTKGFYIARRAALETQKTTAAGIKHELEANAATALVQLKSGRFSRAKKNSTYGFGSRYNPRIPRLAKIINARRREHGERGLEGEEMQIAMVKVLGARLRSIAFLASGWIPAIKAFEPLAEKKSGAPPLDRKIVKTVGQPKGGASIAKKGWTARALLWNSAIAKNSTRSSVPYLVAALQKAFDFEAASMREYIMKKMQATADRFNGRKH